MKLNIFKRKRITAEWVRSHYPKPFNAIYEGHLIGEIPECNGNKLAIDIRNNCICLIMGYSVSSYWICDLEYIYQLKQMLKIYKIK